MLTTHIPGNSVLPSYASHATAWLGEPDTESPFAAATVLGGQVGGQLAWANVTTALALDWYEPVLAALNAGQLVVTFGIDGDISGETATVDTMLIYECWMDVVFADGSAATLRPTVATASPNGYGTILNPQLAIDGDLTTYATIERSPNTDINNQPLIQLSGWGLAASGGGGGGEETLTQVMETHIYTVPLY